MILIADAQKGRRGKMSKKKYNNSLYHPTVWQHFKLRWSRRDDNQSVYGEHYSVWSGGYKLENIREVKKVICGPKKAALQYTKEIRRFLRSEGCDPSLEELKRYIDGMLDSAIEEVGKPDPGPPYYGWR